MTNLKKKAKEKKKAREKQRLLDRTSEKSDNEDWFSKLTHEESMRLTAYSLCGTWIMRTNTILMGESAMNRYLNYKEELKKKYTT